MKFMNLFLFKKKNKHFYIVTIQSQSLPSHHGQGDNNAAPATSDNSTSPVKRRRGRPRGTPNKPLLPDRTNSKSRSMNLCKMKFLLRFLFKPICSLLALILMMVHSVSARILISHISPPSPPPNFSEPKNVKKSINAKNSG